MTHDHKPASLTKRILAHVLDALVFTMLLYFLLYMIYEFIPYNPTFSTTFSLGYWYFYFVHCQWKYGNTFGKLAQRIMIVSTTGTPLTLKQVLFRETVGRIVSGALWIGYLWIFFDQQHRAWHDLFAKTIVVDMDATS